MRTLLIVVLLIVVGIAGYGWWTRGESPVVLVHPADSPVGTVGHIDVSKARERGAQVGEKAAQIAATIQETVSEAELTSKIKAKMALDDYVRALAINVSTSGSTVTLTGTVRSNTERERAMALARETAGVTRVVDRMEIGR